MNMTVNLGTKDFPKDISKEFLDRYVGKKIEDICTIFGETSDEHNHCAHFVSHVLGFRIGLLCNSMKYETRNDTDSGRSIRVNDLFNNCPERGYWSDKPKDLDCCLIFAVLKSQINNDGGALTISTHPKKHVGIYHKGNAYNYGNTKDKVRVDGVAHFQSLYGKGTVALYAKFPT
jgi:hypothetical protein